MNELTQNSIGRNRDSRRRELMREISRDLGVEFNSLKKDRKSTTLYVRTEDLKKIADNV